MTLFIFRLKAFRVVMIFAQLQAINITINEVRLGVYLYAYVN